MCYYAGGATPSSATNKLLVGNKGGRLGCDGFLSGFTPQPLNSRGRWRLRFFVQLCKHCVHGEGQTSLSLFGRCKTAADGLGQGQAQRCSLRQEQNIPGICQNRSSNVSSGDLISNTTAGTSVTVLPRTYGRFTIITSGTTWREVLIRNLVSVKTTNPNVLRSWCKYAETIVCKSPLSCVPTFLPISTPSAYSMSGS